MSNSKRPVVLCILDGFGFGDKSKYDAVEQANTPNFDGIKNTCPGSTLTTFGLDVGLPEGQMGNSEVGHMNIGAGRVVMQFLPRIDKAFSDGSVQDIVQFQDVVTKLKETGGTCHVMGLVSDGGVHAHLDHIKGLFGALDNAGVSAVLHAFTDGRDTAPQSGKAFIEQMDGIDVGTVSGRYYAMDRDNRWDRVQKAYDAIVCAKGEVALSASGAVAQSYDQGTTDEFVLPTVVDGYNGMKDGDAILFANYRSDRAREILNALLFKDFEGFKRTKTIDFCAAAGMVNYSDDLNELMTTLFPPETHKNILGEVVSAHGLKQLRVAETEKYPHVTFFFNNGREVPFDGEERILVPSPKVATYDLQPEMSAPELTQKLCAAIDKGVYDMVIVNYANPDMVGHTGDLDAVKKAIEAVDAGLGKLKDSVMGQDGILIVTADHGNADKMWDETTNGPHTAHTLNPVPVYICGVDKTVKVRDGGRLADLAPTILALLDITQPEDMTGKSLISD